MVTGVERNSEKVAQAGYCTVVVLILPRACRWHMCF